MKKLFGSIYQYLSEHKAVMWIALISSTIMFAVFAARVEVDENISSFFPSENKLTDFVLNNMKSTDKIVLLIEPAADTADVFAAVEALADSFQKLLPPEVELSYLFDSQTETELPQYVLSHLPLLLTEADYAHLDTLCTPQQIEQSMQNNRNLLASPLGFGPIIEVIQSDPIGMSGSAMQKLLTLRPDNNIGVSDDGYMTIGNNALMFADLPHNFSDTGNNATVVNIVREQAQSVGVAFGTNIWAYGAPIVAVSNSACVKADEVLTVSISIALTALIIFLVFRRKRAVFLVILPVIYGALFAFAAIGALGLQLSLISVGTGAIVLALAMSYSIHMLTHSLHSDDIKSLVAEMTYPMTVGSITTIGAFVGLIFTNSKILQDLGLLASLALLGTLLFCLIFLPHFLSPDKEQKHSFSMRLIERVANYDYVGNKLIVCAIAVLTIVGLCFFTDVKFNADMSSLNYTGDTWIEQSRSKIEQLLNPSADTLHHTTIVVTGSTPDELAHNGEQLTQQAAQMQGVRSITSLAPWFLQTDSAKQAKLNRWRAFWTPQRKAQVQADVYQAATANGFAANAFEPFLSIINNQQMPSVNNPTIFSQYLSEACGIQMLYVNIAIDNSSKDLIMSRLSQCEGVVVADMGYFVRKATNGIVSNFNFILALSSVLVGLVLLLSYGRFELFVMTFMPMCISWVIILGLMALIGIEFNVVNIILSTFIFGVGDDFSIFIMDGLLSRYKGEKDMLVSHKMAIALSAIAIVIGLGVQVFAEHPACKSIGYLSIFGLIAVILTSYVVQPILFRTFISKPAQKGQPYTLLSLGRAIVYYGTFIIGCIVGQVIMLLILILPCKLATKKLMVHYVLYGFMHFFYYKIQLFSVRIKDIGTVDLSKPCIVVANHQSFIDIIYVLSLSPRIVCVAKSWVTTSPLFGLLIRFCDFYNADDGHAEMLTHIRQCLAHGYSVVIFPEGTRSADCQIHRFHKGAFMLSQQLGINIQPIVIYGNGMIVSKNQPLNIKRGWIVNKALPSISADEVQNTDVSTLTKRTCTLMRAEYEKLKQEFDTDDNPYYREAILHSYVYKDNSEYWRIRLSLGNAQTLHAEREKLNL